MRAMGFITVGREMNSKNCNQHGVYSEYFGFGYELLLIVCMSIALWDVFPGLPSLI
jgi:hypothetical protein